MSAFDDQVARSSAEVGRLSQEFDAVDSSLFALLGVISLRSRAQGWIEELVADAPAEQQRGLVTDDQLIDILLGCLALNLSVQEALVEIGEPELAPEIGSEVVRQLGPSEACEATLSAESLLR